MSRRTQQAIVLAAVTGVITGLGVALFEWLTREVIFDHVHRLAAGWQIAAPGAGLLLAAAALRWLAKGASPSTADEYIHNFHEERRLPLAPVAGRMVASVATLGFGGAMGYEGPSIYFGAAAGSGLQGRLSRFFSREDTKVLLVAGAAAGVAAIFKAPATGLVFALEVPYQEDFARRMLLPAGIAAAISYLTFVAIHGTEPLFAVSGSPPFDLRDLGGALVLGALCGVGARLFTLLLLYAKRVSAATPPLVRALVGGAGLAALGALSYVAFDRNLTIGAGYDNLAWAFDPKRAVSLVLLLFVMRALATVLTVGGGGAGGLFIPLVIEGALLGRAVGGLFRSAASGSNFFPLIGVSAFLGAGYRVPLAAVVFAAESTGRPGFIVPGLIAAVVAQLFMGRASVSPYQMARRAGHLERRFVLPVTTVLRTDIHTAPPDTTLDEFFRQHLLGHRERAVPVVDGSHYLGVMRLEELHGSPPDEWTRVRVADRMRTDYPTGEPAWQLRDAMAAMEAADIDLLPIVDHGRFVGVVTTSEILKLDEILGEAGGEPG
jgi:CIC family chloride channel protein